MLPRVCTFCSKQDVKLFKCSSCRCTLYCSKECQASDWKKHKPVCTDSDKNRMYCMRLKESIESLRLDELYCSTVYYHRLGMYPYVSLTQRDAKRILLGKEKIPELSSTPSLPVPSYSPKGSELHISVEGACIACVVTHDEDDITISCRVSKRDREDIKLSLTKDLLSDLLELQQGNIKSLPPRARLVHACNSLLGIRGYDVSKYKKIFDAYSKSGKEGLIETDDYIVLLTHNTLMRVMNRLK